MAPIIINSEYEDLVPRLSEEEYTLLKESIRSRGQLVPIIITSDGVILDGHSRFKICKELGFEPKTQTKNVKEGQDIREVVIELNLNRRQLNPAQKAQLGMKLESIIRERARDNQVEAGRQRGRGGESFGSIGLEQTHTRKAVSKKIGLSETTYGKAKKVLEFGDEPTIQSFLSGDISTDAAYRRIKKYEPKPVIKEPVVMKIHLNSDLWESIVSGENKFTYQIAKHRFPLVSKVPDLLKLTYGFQEEDGLIEAEIESVSVNFNIKNVKIVQGRRRARK